MTKPLETTRTALIAQLEQADEFDISIIGGGATGLGVALAAALGGVRYLAQGNVALVYEALHERANLLHNAPHIAQPLSFVMPSYKFWETPFYGAGLKAYDVLAGKSGLGATEFLSRKHTLQALPALKADGLKGGVKYWDGQFDDARLALALARTAALHGALLVNYCAARELLHENGRVSGVACEDTETGVLHTLRARCIVNATGVWVDALRQQDGEATRARA